ncbi:MAG: hypothetical protein GQ569_05515 [Methylococcaceae bacterium]|nr:hypothetical protein [Methylococcaceae bacterium]
MNIHADVAAYNSDGELTLIVEVKNKLGTDSEWATKMRRNILAHGLLPNVRFFLLALPDRFYLWKDKSSTEIEKPTYEIDAKAFLKLYFEKVHIQPEKISGMGFEILINLWLNELLQKSSLLESFKQDKNNQWLIESGLLEVIKHGRIVSETIV